MYIQMDFNSCEDTSYMQQTGLGLPMMDNPSPVFCYVHLYITNDI